MELADDMMTVIGEPKRIVPGSLIHQEIAWGMLFMKQHPLEK